MVAHKLFKQYHLREGVHLTLMDSNDPSLQFSARALRARGVEHSLLLEIDKSAKASLTQYERLKETPGIQWNQYQWREEETEGKKVKVHLLPTPACIDALTAKTYETSKVVGVCKAGDAAIIKKILEENCARDIEALRRKPFLVRQFGKKDEPPSR